MRSHSLYRRMVKGVVFGGLLAACLAVHAGLVMAAVQWRDLILPAIPWIATVVIVTIVYKDTRATLRELRQRRRLESPYPLARP